MVLDEKSNFSLIIEDFILVDFLCRFEVKKTEAMGKK